jgi:hypothetical protein
MCGAYDCYACRGESALRYRAWEAAGCPEPENCACGEEKDWETGECPDCGETPDPENITDPEAAEVCTTVLSTTHVARKEHVEVYGGRIQPGDTYRRTVYMGYIGPCRDFPEGGPRWLRVSKRLISRAP